MSDWPNDVTLEFLRLYEQEPAIWHPRDPQHKNRSAVTDAWNRIAGALSVPSSVPELKKKKDSLMASFRSLVNKVEDSLKSGCPKEDLYRPSWFAYEAMESFLKAVYVPRKFLNYPAETSHSVALEEEEKELEIKEEPVEQEDAEPEVKEEQVEQEDAVGELVQIDEEVRAAAAIREPIIIIETSSVVDGRPEVHASGISRRSSHWPSAALPPAAPSGPSRFHPLPPPGGGGVKRKRTSGQQGPSVDPLEKRMDEAYTLMKNLTAPKDTCALYGELLAMKLRSYDETTSELIMHEIDHLMLQFKMKRRPNLFHDDPLQQSMSSTSPPSQPHHPHPVGVSYLATSTVSPAHSPDATSAPPTPSSSHLQSWEDP